MSKSQSFPADTETLWAAARQRSFTFLAPTLSHDIRGPLNAMGINLEVIRRLNARGDDPATTTEEKRRIRDKQEQYLQTIQAQIERLNVMIQDILTRAYAPLSAKPVTQNLTRLIEAQEQSLASLGHQLQITLRSHLPPRGCHVQARQGWLEQVLLDMFLEAMLCLAKGDTLDATLEAGEEEACFRILGRRDDTEDKSDPPRGLDEDTLGTASLLAAEVGGKLAWSQSAGEDEAEVVSLSLRLPLLRETEA